MRGYKWLYVPVAGLYGCGLGVGLWGAILGELMAQKKPRIWGCGAEAVARGSAGCVYAV